MKAKIMKPTSEENATFAEKIYEKHLVLTEWLVSLGVDRKISEHDACKIEHVLSDESFAALKKHISEEQ